MILQALTEYYEALAGEDGAPAPGWSVGTVSYALELDMDGRPLRLYPITTETPDGKRTVPRSLRIPARAKKTSGKKSNFLCENAEYLLGLGKAGDDARGQACFSCAGQLHHAVLDGVDDAAARAVCAYFDSWDAGAARESGLLSTYLDALEKGPNIALMIDGRFAHEYDGIRRAWQRYYDGADDGEDAVRLRCLVTGDVAVPEKVHPSIKGIYGAQSSGAALVSFNAPAFCSYKREQSENAPVGKYAAFAYTAALNALIADQRHMRRIGDTTVLFWAKGAKPGYQETFADFFDGGSDTMAGDDLLSLMDKLAGGEPIDRGGICIKPQNEFFILGLSPNAARLSVRFFLRGAFGSFVQNLEDHYTRTDIVSDGRSKFRCIPLWALLAETVNSMARSRAPSPHMAADTLRAVLLGTRYPATLYQRTQVRIRADRELTRGRAAIIKAYLLKNFPDKNFKEALQVNLNEETTYPPYVLGRLFAVLEGIQQSANPGINTTIKDKYFSSACATPAVVFPLLVKLAQSHLKKLNPGLKILCDKQLTALMSRLQESFPQHLDLNDQGVFQLGYYHQTQKRFEKKKTDTEEK